MAKTDALREKLMDAAIAHVPFDGWGDKALLAAAKDLHVDAALAHNAFPGGAIEMIEFHSLLADRRMMAAYEAEATGELKLREKVALAIRLANRNVEVVRTDSLRIESPSITAYADGEYLGPLPVDITLLPHAVRVLVGRQPT